MWLKLLIQFMSCVFMSSALGQSSAVTQRISTTRLPSSASTDNFVKDSIASRSPSDGLGKIIRMGQRNLELLRRINSGRSKPDLLNLSHPQSQPSYPVDRPLVYNEESLGITYQEILSALPPELRKLVLGENELPFQLPLPEQEYIMHAIEISRLYERTIRWVTNFPNLKYLALRKKNDVRGYYHLIRTENIYGKLRDISRLPEKSQVQLRHWLVGLCFNGSASESQCRSELDAISSTGGSLSSFYAKYLGDGLRNWNSFFTMRSPRLDLSWKTSNQNITVLEFARPENPDAATFLKRNVEAEWRTDGWNLKINFVDDGRFLPKLVFTPDVTPHVNALGGNRIIMDANVPLTEYNAEWTVRHEFGHILGLPDCYLEFYDTSKKEIVSYQLDVENIMCSRRGRFNGTIFAELKKAYLK